MPNPPGPTTTPTAPTAHPAAPAGTPPAPPPIPPSTSAVKERKFPCKGCGADLVYAPGQFALKCPNCGFVEKIPQTPQEIKEYDFNEYLAKPKSTGFGAPAAERRNAKCPACYAVIQLDTNVRSTKCPYCGAPMITDDDHAATQNVITPEGIVPFEITLQQAQNTFRMWLAALWFAPNALTGEAHLKQFQGIYRPYWTYDAHTNSHWTGQRGDYYYVTETYNTIENGQNVTRTRQVRHTSWSYVSGVHSDFFDDVLIPAGKSQDRSSAFELKKGLKHYDPEFISGFGAERYSVSCEDGWKAAKQTIDSSIYSSVQREIGGDEQRVEGIQTAYSGIMYKHILLPIWINTYLYGGSTYFFEVNGQTGKAAGTRPYSFWKIFALVCGILFALGLTALVVYLLHGSR